MLSAEKLIILDRDGVINHDSDDYIKSLDEWVPYPSSITAIARLTRAGYSIAVATNQSGIARGYYDEATLHAMHEHLIALVEAEGGHIEHIAYCPHGPNDGCQCRKPLPGMLRQIKQILMLEGLAGSWMVGDSLRDLEAGEVMGCNTVLVRTGKGAKTQQKGVGLEKTKIFDDLAHFVDWLIE
ncbi:MULTISPECIES: D-glycero-beta-D-manno-heptose 1,7-bisphosphate 7-phosphatase [unclassified Halomonas]|uniref:D-glycero-beta-D-manno-heptose 1,7-bisphosphate 7-phosphatase n=1 Tax=unclassified Halomonas TaxID=2609666 RepID=UPI0007D9E1FC|nr:MULTISPECIES: D-glycero-beta-D-manno-heptose 1,7-bisphosphate 7-phosphatase [unclassified Halomonas]MBT2787659.1 D-glycero-beta-D-manno-heptose 1,7-bisphosphate 7-phosphatase [Halomonas sp. ISL-106]MBT2798958.1 D-glycero-beta-D-manno-heptose 1,7-bisphosphate 7-phosphatase [Halomonas sp. ISL-104]OAL61605.1 D-glycero-beta-D-manno-heptose-1,7-bisphosphate 7-phosphatase [Halomonas sp. ALS9]